MYVYVVLYLYVNVVVVCGGEVGDGVVVVVGEVEEVVFVVD